MKKIILIIIILGLIIAGFYFLNKKSAISNLKNMPNDNIVQTVLNVPELQQYFKTQKVVILKNQFVENEPKLEKFGKPVEYVAEPPETGDFFVFDKIEVVDDKANVEFFYPKENIYGKIELQFKNNGWEVISKNIVER